MKIFICKRTYPSESIIVFSTQKLAEEFCNNYKNDNKGVLKTYLYHWDEHEVNL